jgi:hypothetical protein
MIDRDDMEERLQILLARQAVEDTYVLPIPSMDEHIAWVNEREERPERCKR